MTSCRRLAIVFSLAGSPMCVFCEEPVAEAYHWQAGDAAQGERAHSRCVAAMVDRRSLLISVRTRIAAIERDIDQTYAYMMRRAEKGDFHGVEDAASDIRDEQARRSALLWVLGEPEAEYEPKRGVQLPCS